MINTIISCLIGFCVAVAVIVFMLESINHKKNKESISSYND